MADETSPLIADNEHVQNHGTITDAAQEPVLEAGGNQQDSDTGYSAKSVMWIIAPMTIGVFLSAMDQTVIIASYAKIGSELKHLQKMSWIATSYMLTVTTFQPLYGKLSDIFGRKACLLTAYIIFGIGSLFCGLAQTMDQLILARALAGIGGGGMPTVVTIIMSDVVPLRTRGAWQGAINIVFSSGQMVGAPLGGFLADTIGWRWAFLIQVPIVVVAFISVSFALRLAPPEISDFSSKLKRVDFPGALALIVFIFCFLFGIDRGGNVSWNDQLTQGALVASGAFFVIFSLIELRWAKEPFAPKRVLVNGSLIAAFFVNFCGIAAQLSMIFHLSLYLQAVNGYSASQAGLALIPGIIGGVSGSLTGGFLIQKTGRYYVITVLACLLQVLGLLTITLNAGVITASVLGMSIGLIVSGLGNGGAITTSLIALISNAGKADQAIATAVSYLFRSLGGVVGVSVGGTILQDTLRNFLRQRLTGRDLEEIVKGVRASLKYLDQLDPETRTIVRHSYESSLHITMCYSLGLAVCSFLCSLFIKEKRLDGS